MKLNIQLFASLNVGDTYETSAVSIRPYGYSSNAYQMKFSVKLNSQNLSNFTSNITITSYMRTLGSSWGWSGFNKIYMERYTKINDEAGYTLKNSTQLAKLPTNNANNWVNCGSWSGDISHRSDGTCTLYVKNHLLTSSSSSYNYIPRDTEQESEALVLNALHKSPTINITGITELNTYLGVANDVFVQHLSKKQFTFTNTLYDSATATGVTISNGSTTSNSDTTSPKTLDFTNKTLYTTANVLPIKAVISDNLNSTGETTVNYSNYILYNKPAINTSTSVKRNGQLSGKALLNFTGTYYNGTIGSTANTITIQYRFWEKGTTEPSTWLTIPSASVLISGNDISIYNYEIGSNDTSASNYFDFQKSYNVKIYIQDAMRDVDGIYMNDAVTKTIPVGEPVWGEYKDRLDAKKITIQNVYETTGVIKDIVNDIKYFKYSDGTLIMTGFFTTSSLLPNNSNGQTIQFPINFINTSYYLGLTKVSGGTLGFADVSDAVYKFVDKFDTTHWNKGNSTADAITYSWFAMGEWK